jgi:pimeloyl-ACP methyl ester carboxylesterase
MSLRLEVITRRPSSDPHPTPLLFVHGAWHAAWCWDVHFLPYFAEQGYVCHAFSLRSHGSSEKDKSLRRTRASDYIKDVAQVVDGLERPPVLIGHSMGGYVVQKYLETHDAPAAVLLATIPAQGIIPYLLRSTARHPLAILHCVLTVSLYPLIGTPERTHEAFFSPDMPLEKVYLYFGRMENEAFPVALDAALLNLPRPERVRTPLLVLGAANDNVFTVDEQHATARAYNTTAEIFPNMAHDMMLEAGWQQVADRILGWLKERGL